MKDDSRTHNTIRNMGAGFFNKMVNVLLPFVIRTLLIYRLGKDYVGLGSLFSAILQVLSVSELGFSSAIIFCLYGPVADRNDDEIQEWLTLFRHIYNRVGIVILCAGLAVLPFLKLLINGSYPLDVNLYILYLIYLTNTSITYFFYSYKRVVLVVNQRRDLLSKVETTVFFAQSVFQIIIIWASSNYYLYALCLPIFSLIVNCAVNVVSKKHYPEQVAKNTPFDKKRLLLISNQIKGLAIGKIALVTRNSFDSLILSAMFGLSILVVYSNYYYIFNSIVAALGVILSSASASIGNSLATETIEKNIEDHNRFDFYYMWIAGWCTVCLLCLYQHFMQLWVGKNLMAPFSTMVLFCIYFYVDRLSQIRALYSEAAGLWWHYKHISVIASVSNVLLNFILGYLWGMNGILIATIITTLAASFIAITIVTYKRLFNTSTTVYYTNNIIYGIVTVIACLLSHYSCQLIKGIGYVAMIEKMVVLLIIPNLIFLIVYLPIPRFKKYIVKLGETIMAKRK